MPLFGPLGILFFAGLALFGAGNWLVFRALARHDGLRRDRLLFVVFDPESPMKRPEAKADRQKFRVGAYLVGFGLVTFYTALSTGDEHELRVCVDRCHRAGYIGGRFGPPAAGSAQAPGRPARACYCVGPAGSVELRQDPLPLPASGPRGPASASP